jgi:hypothetical protein
MSMFGGMSGVKICRICEYLTQSALRVFHFRKEAWGVGTKKFRISIRKQCGRIQDRLFVTSGSLV